MVVGMWGWLAKHPARKMNLKEAEPMQGALSIAGPPAEETANGKPAILAERLRKIRHVALDMDGTIYKGETLFKVTDPFLRLLKDLGIGYTFLTNNPSKSVNDYLAHLRTMGIHATADQLYTSAQATIEFLRADRPAVQRLFVLGTPSMCEQFVAAGFILLP